MTTARFAIVLTTPNPVTTAPVLRRPRRRQTIPNPSTIAPITVAIGAIVGANRAAAELNGPSPGMSDARPMTAAIAPNTSARMRPVARTVLAARWGTAGCDELLLAVIFGPRLPICRVEIPAAADLIVAVTS
ncbi:hypothetical protein GCM10010974_02430 [Brevibacterium sediminis]|uniref:Uncharacterized protein n=1 Tax=Brevibacterium sediminis TaxID=1857024 RepID=A0ABQ1LGZ3_9MICO|nr:hypothetical protein GCM10010974_02430 [Brevibacterium sediminis]